MLGGLCSSATRAYTRIVNMTVSHKNLSICISTTNGLTNRNLRTVFKASCIRSGNIKVVRSVIYYVNFFSAGIILEDIGSTSSSHIKITAIIAIPSTVICGSNRSIRKRTTISKPSSIYYNFKLVVAFSKFNLKCMKSTSTIVHRILRRTPTIKTTCNSNGIGRSRGCGDYCKSHHKKHYDN